MSHWRPIRTALLATTAVVPLVLVASAIANPLGPNVVGGTANVTGTGTANVIVNQSSQNAIINWQSFNIGVGESTRFIQPNSTAMTLNRVTGAMGPSSIYGSITANGRIFIVNPDGILIGRGATINTAGFLATTHDISNADFMANRLNFNIPGRHDASIVNEGIVTATNGGFAALVAPGVRNSGTITATFGRIGLAAANGFSLDLYGDQLITLGVNDVIAAQVRDVATGLPLSALVKNDGVLKANGGRVELTAAAARTVVDSVINTSGVIEARTIGRREGKIVLAAATAATKPGGLPQQTVKVSGKLTVASKKAKAGTIQITGENIEVTNATLDATGYLGGGIVLIGGDIGGGHVAAAVAAIPQAKLQAGPVPRATTVTIDGATVINASATGVGDAGKVVVWADGSTTFAGTILARGGPLGGNGGFVEVSGKQTLNFLGTVDTRAPLGSSGMLLLDPATLIIDVALANTISTNLTTTSVTLSADIDLYLTADITKSAGPDATLTFIAPFIYHQENVRIVSTAGKLNVNYDASDRIFFGRGFENGEATIITNGGNVTFHGTHFVGVNGIVNAGTGQVLIRSEKPFEVDFSDQGIWLFGNTAITGSSITLDSPLVRIDPGVTQTIRPLPDTPNGSPPDIPPPPVFNNSAPPPDNSGPLVVLTSLIPPPGPGATPGPGGTTRPVGQPFAPPQFVRAVVAFDGTRTSGLPPVNETRFLRDEIVFQISNTLSPEELARIAQQLGLTVISSENLTALGRRVVRFRITGGRSLRDIIRLADQNPNVIATPNYQFHVTQAPAALPPTPDANRGDAAQYTLQKLHVHELHRLTSGTNITIAVIDSEVDKDHSELAGTIAQRYDAVGVQDKAHSHGTAMVGAMVSRDRLLGIAPRARILAVRAFSESQTTAEGTTFNILKGIEWAVSQGARVINMSFAGPYDPALAKALKAAYDKGVVLVAAAGNAGPKSPPLFPGADVRVIGVTATDNTDRLFKGANVGGYVSLAAPGVEILAAAPQESYQMSTGTSIATAHISAVVALILERDPTLKPDDVRKILQESATDLGAKGKDNQFGWGLVNPQKALAAVEARRKNPTATIRP